MYRVQNKATGNLRKSYKLLEKVIKLLCFALFVNVKVRTLRKNKRLLQELLTNYLLGAPKS